MQIPQTTPQVDETFQHTDLVLNQNRVWRVRWWPEGIMVTSFNRVEESPRHSEPKSASLTEVKALIASKLRKGYQSVLKAVVQVPTTADDDTAPEVKDILTRLFAEAGENIAQYLTVKVDTLSKRNIDEGNRVLELIESANINQMDYLIGLANQYFTAIPTRLPRRQTAKETARHLFMNIDEQFTRLQQLEAAIAAEGADTGTSMLKALGDTRLALIPHTDPRFGNILDRFKRSGGYGVVENIFAVRIESEFAAYNPSVGNEQLLWHGTKASNARHILRTGLSLSKANSGGRMGPGLYFSDKAKRSLNYTSGNKVKGILFLAQVALGKQWKTSGTYAGSKPPVGFDSTWGDENWSGDGDEMVIYDTRQHTIRAMVVLK